MKVLNRLGKRINDFIAGLEFKKVFSNLHFPLLILMIMYSVFGLIMIFYPTFLKIMLTAIQTTMNN